MDIDFILDDLYEEAYYWDTLRYYHFCVEDAERVVYLHEFCGYYYREAIHKVLCEIEDELIQWGY